MTDTDRTDRIRERAHHLWEQDGRPDGKEADHWAQAEAELAENTGTSSGGDQGNHSDPDHDSPAPTDPTTSATAASKPPRKRAAK